jgi:nicotinamidase/pyrazinamidase
MTEIKESLQDGDAIIIVDVQKDFCPGGALPIEEGDKIIPALNRWIAAAVSREVPVYASRDWHPLGHNSFKENGGLWPPHCIQDSDGASFQADLKLPEGVIKVTKGVRFDRDQNSAFDETGLAEELRKRSVQRVLVGGLAEDVCVLATVLDGRREGFEVVMIEDATRPVTPGGGERARKKMREAGTHFVRTF